jgi:RNA polymerase sigma-70 factor (ECF subfamily)
MESVMSTASVRGAAKPEITAEALEQIYRAYYKNVYNYICFRINNHFDAEDLACAVFEKAARGWGRYSPAQPLEAWLIGIAKNTVTDYFRARSRRRFVSLESVFGLISLKKQPEEVVVSNEENRALILALSKLKDRERQILSMKFATDLKNNEIAALLNISPTNVGAIVHRALKKMKILLQEEGE